MESQKLRITYQPAKKEIVFSRCDANGKRIAIRNDSVLAPYMKEKGKFILQDHGDQFFRDIASAFDGEELVNIEAVMTKSDFGDLEQMIEHYNEENEVQLRATQIAELPNMEQAFEAVKQHGEKAIGKLELHKRNFYAVSSDAEDVHRYINNFAGEVDVSAKQIRDKIDVLKDNNINLCFAGVYSAGKSALINALLGYRILPEATSSKTARMFIIRSPKKDEPVRICFNIGKDMTDILWDKKKSVFVFGTSSPTEVSARKAIQEVINQNKAEMQHLQAYRILEKLNESEDVTSDIQVFFPIPLDTPNMQFTIYDTPGTDSNYAAHREVLEEALESQTNSILIFVVAPIKLEGEGNRALLSYLEAAEKKGNKTNIDIDRSLFVMNYIDGQSQEEIRKLQRSELRCKEGENFDDEGEGRLIIQLGNKKLFFTSAKYGYAARAMQNNVADKNDQKVMKFCYDAAVDEEFGRYYRYDHVATSECASERLIRDSENALKEALSKGNKAQAMLVCSGVYALESEIRTYGEKYASAVKTAAIIDSVDNALVRMSKTANSLHTENQRAISQIDSEIRELESTLESAIKKARGNYDIKKNQLPYEDLDQLHLNADWIETDIKTPTKERMSKILGKNFLIKKIRAKQEHKKQIQKELETILKDYSRGFQKSRQALLVKKRDGFIEDIRKAIQENGNISESAKTEICDIRKPEVKKVDLFSLNKIYDQNVSKKNFLFLRWDVVDKTRLKEDVEDECNKIAEKMCDDYTKEYEGALKLILDQVQKEFERNIEKYSVKIQALYDDKKAMEELREKILKAEDDLKGCQRELDVAICGLEGDAQ